MSENNPYSTVEEYIALCPIEIQPRLQQLRQIIHDIEPEFIEKISWRMPTFYYKGNIIHFASHTKHIGLYPGADAVEYFAERLKDYKTSKGAIQIPNEKAFDVELITDIVKYNLAKKK